MEDRKVKAIYKSDSACPSFLSYQREVKGEYVIQPNAGMWCFQFSGVTTYCGQGYQ